MSFRTTKYVLILTVMLLLPSLAHLQSAQNTINKSSGLTPLPDASSTFTSRGPIIFSDDMESGENGWTHGGIEDEWELGTPGTNQDNPNDPNPQAHSGVNCWGTDLDGYYNKNTSSWLMTPALDLSSMASVTVDFWLWYDVTAEIGDTPVENNTDVLTFQAKSSPCGIWTDLDIFNHTTYEESTWLHIYINVTKTMECTGNVYFRFFLQDMDNLSEDNGAYVDDFTVRGVPRADKDISLNSATLSSENETYAPGDLLPVGKQIEVLVNISNEGLYAVDNIKVDLSVGDKYQSTTVSDLAPNAFAEVYFYITLESSGSYTFNMEVRADGDTILSNNKLSLNFDAYTYILKSDFAGHPWNHSSLNGNPDLWHVSNGSYVCRNDTEGTYYNLMLDALETPFMDASAFNTAYLIINHDGDFEWDSAGFWDGGYLEVWNGSWEPIAPESGYNGVISSGSGNLKAGEPAFVGEFTDRTDIFNLTPYISSHLKVRFVFSSDSVNTLAGWTVKSALFYGDEMDDYDVTLVSVSSRPYYIIDDMPIHLDVSLNIKNSGLYFVPKVSGTVEVQQTVMRTSTNTVEWSEPLTVWTQEFTTPAFEKGEVRTYVVSLNTADLGLETGDYRLTVKLAPVDTETHIEDNTGTYDFIVRKLLDDNNFSTPASARTDVGWHLGNSLECNTPGEGSWTAEVDMDLRNVTSAVMLISHSYDVTGNGGAMVYVIENEKRIPLAPASNQEYDSHGYETGHGFHGTQDSVQTAFDLTPYMGKLIAVDFTLNDTGLTTGHWQINRVQLIGTGDAMTHHTIITCDQQSYGGNSGKTVNVDMVLKNSGNVMDSYILFAESNAWSVNLNISAISLDVGESAHVTARVNISDSALPGASGNVTVVAVGARDQASVEFTVFVPDFKPYVLKYGELSIYMETRGSGTAYLTPLNMTTPVEAIVGPLTLNSTFNEIRNVTLTYRYSPDSLIHGDYEYLPDTLSIYVLMENQWYKAKTVGDTEGMLSAKLEGYSFFIGAVKNIYPTANIAQPAHETTVYQGDVLTLSAEGSSDTDGIITQYYWESNIQGPLGAGRVVYAQMKELGRHTITLTVVDNLGARAYMDVTVNVIKNLPPQVQIFTNTTEIHPGVRVYFYSQASDPENDKMTYLWDFGDGETSTDPRPDHEFQKAGTYRVTLTVSDGRGETVAHYTVIVSEAIQSEEREDRSIASAFAYEATTTVGLFLILVFLALLILALSRRYTGSNFIIYSGFLLMLGAMEYDSALGRPTTNLGPTAQWSIILGALIAFVGILSAYKVRFNGWYGSFVFILGMISSYIALESDKTSMIKDVNYPLFYYSGVGLIFISLIIAYIASKKEKPIVDEQELERKLDRVTVGKAPLVGEDEFIETPKNESDNEWLDVAQESASKSKPDHHDDEMIKVHLKCPSCGAKGRVILPASMVRENNTVYLACPSCGVEGVFDIPDEVKEAL